MDTLGPHKSVLIYHSVLIFQVILCHHLRLELSVCIMQVFIIFSNGLSNRYSTFFQFWQALMTCLVTKATLIHNIDEKCQIK